MHVGNDWRFGLSFARAWQRGPLATLLARSPLLKGVTSLRALTFTAYLVLGACAPQANSTSSEEGNSEEVTAPEANQHWVIVERLDRHSCPSKDCGVVGQVFFREAVFPIESKDGWTRITKMYDGACSGGKSKYVDVGDKACTANNGFENGQFAEWVESEHLSETRPADPAADAKEDEQLVSGSDDFGRYRSQFAKAARQLIEDGRCTREEFEEMGGWVKSVNDRDAPVYFTYCGGMTVANRLYLNAETGQIYR